jgi:hypothetical protein
MSKLKEKILNLIDKLGLWETKEIMGVSLVKLVRLADLKIDSGLAGEIIIEGINNETLPTEYKEFKISTNSDGVVYWEGKLKTDHFLPDLIETIWVMATPFWDGMKYTPVESDWYSLITSQDTLIDEIEAGGDYYEQLDEVEVFSNVDDLLSWYEKIYLPGVYQIIMGNFLPKLQQDMDDRLNEDTITESIVRVLREETEGDKKINKVKSFIKRATRLINTIKFPAVKRIEFDYDEMMDGYHVNIFFDRQFVIDNPRNFNKVKQNSIKEIGSTVTSYFPFKFYFYIHYE